MMNNVVIDKRYMMNGLFSVWFNQRGENIFIKVSIGTGMKDI